MTQKNISPSNHVPLVKTKIFGIDVTNATKEKILEYLLNFLKSSSEKLFVVTPNPEIIMLAQAQPGFRTILNSAQIALCDGVGLLMASRFVGRPLKERIIGTDFMEMVCKAIADWPVMVGFLGGRPGVAEKTAECLKARYPNLKISFAEADENKLLALPKEKMPTVLFVAFGAPKQEEWMAEHIDKLPVRVMMGVGGAFDQIVSPSLRPPVLVHHVGLGWLYRLIREPWRFKRQGKLLGFLSMVLKEKLQQLFFHPADPLSLEAKTGGQHLP